MLLKFKTENVIENILHFISYLERVLSYLSDPYEMALVTYALTLANSAAKETAFGKLNSLKRENGLCCKTFLFKLIFI